jgi:iron-sulfur cluster assembly protein
MLKLTEAASRKIQEVITQQREHGSSVLGLRLSVYPGGCSGFQYGMSLAEKAEDGDWTGEFDGVKVLVDRESQPLIEGVAIDYVETLQAQGFTISNPNARSCGCGKSFDAEGAQGGEGAGSAEGGGQHQHGSGGGGCGCGGH